MISAQNLVYSLQGRCLTDNVSLTFPGGEIVAILGPNGAGKIYAASPVNRLSST
ncbi:hemin importer ATP-binding subunit [Escherichia coli]|nr:hemin importer ATP-binding subunit [Escherichia coli]